jgi:hypothetical protein
VGEGFEEFHAAHVRALTVQVYAHVGDMDQPTSWRA